MPAAAIVVGIATTIATTAYAQHQGTSASKEATRRENEAAKVQDEANTRALMIAKEQQDYDRWLQSAGGAARQPYMDLAAGVDEGRDYDPGAYQAAAPFVAPTREAAQTDPGYGVAVEEGQRVMGETPEARNLAGPIREDLQRYGDRAATGQYDKVYNRAISAASLAEMLRGKRYDMETGAGFNAARLRGASADARRQGYLNLASLALPGRFPGTTPPGSY